MQINLSNWHTDVDKFAYYRLQLSGLCSAKVGI